MNIIDSLIILSDCTVEEAVACSKIIPNGLPGSLAILIHYAYLTIEVAVPVILILFGMIGFIKALMSQKEDEIRSAQSAFIKKLIIAVIVFLVLAIVHLVFNIVSNSGANTNSQNIWTCVEQLLNGVCD